MNHFTKLFTVLAVSISLLRPDSALATRVPAWTWGSHPEDSWSPKHRNLAEFWTSFQQEQTSRSVFVLYLVDSLSLYDVSLISQAFDTAVASKAMTTLQDVMTSAKWSDWRSSFPQVVSKPKAGVPGITVPDFMYSHDRATRVWVVAEPSTDLSNVELPSDTFVIDHKQAIDRFEHQNIKSGNTFDVVVIPLKRHHLNDDMQFVQNVEEYLRNGKLPADYTALFTSLKDGFRAPHASTQRKLQLARRELSTVLQTTEGNSTTPTDAMRLTPDIMTGLLLMFILGAATICAISCLHTIQTPTKFHSAPLAVGKES